jgi:oligogalacturonide lyase
MAVDRPRSGWTRRALLSGLLFSPSGLTQVIRRGDRYPTFPSTWRRYADPATEFVVLRLTDPDHASVLPSQPERAIARRGNFLLFASDRAGAWQIFRLDLKNGETRQLTGGENIDRRHFSLGADERTVYFADGNIIKAAGARERELYRAPEGWSRAAFAVSPDGLTLAAVLHREGSYRLVARQTGATRTLLETASPIDELQFRPGRAGLLFRSGSAWSLSALDGRAPRALPLEGKPGQALWTPDGRTLCYLSEPEEAGKLIALREFTPEGNTDRLIGPTSQFASFGMNSDATVFAGATRGKAQPYVLLLLRITRRELPLCEHKDSDAASVRPFFTPDSQRVIFQSDRFGKPVLLAIPVERLVERTESATSG